MDTESGGVGSRQKDTLEPRAVDAYWLQREINKFMNDPLVSSLYFCDPELAQMSLNIHKDLET